MTLKEKLELFKNRGYTYNRETGEVTSCTGRILDYIDHRGYVVCSNRFNLISVLIGCHQFAWYMETGEVPNVIDHKDHNKTNNIFSNLRNVTHKINQHNRDNVKGYSKSRNKYRSYIKLNNKKIYI